MTDQEKIDQVLLGDGSLHELKPFFPSREAVLKYHAQRMAALFPPERPVAECDCCHRRSAALHIALQWRGLYHTAGTVVATIIGIAASLGGQGMLSHRRIDFTTTHGMCDDCFRQMRRRKILGELAEKICFILIILSAIVFAMAVVMTPVLLMSRPTARDLAVIVITLGGGTAGLVGALWGATRAVRWYIPQSLKFIAKPPFQLVGLRKL